jgi:hypothetical protein
MCTCVLFRTVSEVELFHCTVKKLLRRKIYYALFLMPVFIVQVTKLVQFTLYNTYISENSTVNINALLNSCEDMACCSSVQCTVNSEISVSRKPFGIGHTYIIHFFA